MATLDHAHSLLRIARRDFNALAAMQGSAAVADAIIGFHAQQAAEKALKAWLTERRRPYPFTHDVSRLLMALESAGADVAPFWSLDRLTAYAGTARYEEGEPDADALLDRHGLVAEVAKLLDHVAAVLNATEN